MSQGTDNEQTWEFEYRFDYTRWPMVTIPSPGNVDPSSISQDSFYQEFDRLRKKDERFFLIHDLRDVPKMDARRRRRFVAYAKHNSASAGKLIAGYGVILDSKLMAGVVTAVLWILRAPCPMKVFPTSAAAELWFRSLNAELAAEIPNSPRSKISA